MDKQKFYLITALWIILILYTQTKSQITGTIKNQYGLQITEAQVTFINLQDRTKTYTTTTNDSGFFTANFPLLEESPENKSHFLAPYPNPNRGNVIIPFYKADENRLKIEIYNLI